MITAILNDIELPGHPKLDQVHKWLRNIPSDTVIDFLGPLPPEALDFFRERVFAAALRANDQDSMQEMITLGFNPDDRIATGEDDGTGALTPLQRALKHRQFGLVRMYLSNMVTNERGVDLDKILSSFQSFTHRQGIQYDDPLFYKE